MLYTDQPKGPRTIEEAYVIINKLLRHPAEDPDWRKEFNEAAEVIERGDWREDEQEVQDGESALASTAVTLPWQAVVHYNHTYIVSPPLMYQHKYLCRLALPIYVVDRNRKEHVPALRIPPPQSYENDSKDGLKDWDAATGIKHSITACVVSSGGLPEIFALWDFIARHVVEVAVENGLVNSDWVTKVEASQPACKGDHHAQAILEKITRVLKSTLAEQVEDILTLLPGYADLDPMDISHRIAFCRYKGDFDPNIKGPKYFEIAVDYWDTILPLLISIKECNPKFAVAIAIQAADVAKGTHNRTIALQALEVTGALHHEPALATGENLGRNNEVPLINRDNVMFERRRYKRRSTLLGLWAARTPVVQHILDKYPELQDNLKEIRELAIKEKHRQTVNHAWWTDIETGFVAFDKFHNAFCRKGFRYIPPEVLIWRVDRIFVPDDAPREQVPAEKLDWWNMKPDIWHLYQSCQGNLEIDNEGYFPYPRPDVKENHPEYFAPPEYPGIRALLEDICKTKRWTWCYWLAFKTHPDQYINYTRKECRAYYASHNRQPGRPEIRRYVVLARHVEYERLWQDKHKLCYKYEHCGDKYATRTGSGIRQWNESLPPKPTKKEIVVIDE